MCKHEFTQEEWIVEVCKNCGKLQQEIELEQQLAEAAEAQCVAYKKALDIAMSTNQSHETYCKVEAALEEKL